MLYAYLLTRSEFQIETAPEKNTRDARYAHALYLDLLLLILQLSGYKVKPGMARGALDSLRDSNVLSDTALAKALSTDLSMRELIAKGSATLDSFDGVLMKLYRKIVDSTVYADYRKKKGAKTMAEDVKLWTVILSTVIAKDSSFLEVARQQEDFTTAGYNQAFKKAAETLLNFSDSRSSLTNAKKSLNDSLEKAYELYVSMLLLPVYLTDLEADRIEAAKDKYCPTDEELNPNTRFIDNQYVRAIRESEAIAAYVKDHPMAWDGDYYMLKKILDDVRQSEIYADYMAAETVTYQDDCELWRHLLKNVIFPGDALAEAMENKSVYWNDDLAVMGTFTLKTIKQMAGAGNGKVELLPVYKNSDDANFGPQLFTAAVKNREEYRSYIDKFVNGSQWDPERLAFTDIVILIAAITELLNFPTIPIPVTLNEYIEIANYYSTARSGQFINGVLYSVVNYLKAEGKLTK
jgi:N utilization substance protein B